jgi:hypothetical protein
MTQAEKLVFIQDLIRSVEKTVVEAIPAMPEEWDGIELREYLAGKFAESSILYRRDHLRKRAKDYANEITVNRKL